MTGGDKHYYDYGTYLRSLFSTKIQKISVNTGFSCPNRDGSKGYGGCTYCNIKSFNPDYCTPERSVTDQINEGIRRFSKNHASAEYLAYFQSYTNTYGDTQRIISKICEAVVHPKVKGIVLGTRPDCIPDELIDFLAELSSTVFVSLELGVESTLNRTLLKVNRCHTFEDTESAFERCKNRGIHLGAHIILGLPGETKKDLLDHARRLSKLPIDTLKIHHLQIVMNTIMAKQYRDQPASFKLFEMNEYLDLLVEFISLLRPDIAIERFINETTPKLLVAPNWGRMKNYAFAHLIDQKLKEKQARQGMLFA